MREPGFLDELIEDDEHETPGFKAQYERYRLIRQMAEYRVKAGRSRADIAKVMGVAASRVAEIERGENVTSERFFVYAQVLGVKLAPVFQPIAERPKRRGRPVSSSAFKA